MTITGPDGPPLTEKEACEALDISRSTLQRGVSDGVVAAPIRIGRLKLYPRPIIWALLSGSPLKRAG